MDQQDSFLAGTNNPQWHLTATLNFAHDAWHLYARGYRDAASQLVEGLQSGSISRGLVNTLIYPIAFLYRQSAELWLKQIVNRLGGTKKTVHKLVDLWNEVEAESRAFNTQYDVSPTSDTDAYFTRIRKRLDNLAVLDATSMAFRYPTDKNDVPHLGNRSHLHIGELADFYNELLDDLEGISAYYDATIDELGDMMSSLGPEF